MLSIYQSRTEKADELRKAGDNLGVTAMIQGLKDIVVLWEIMISY